MKTMIEDSDYYLKNFKPSRDSEFSSGGMNGPDLDKMKQLRSNRHQEIPPSDRSNIQIIKIDKRNASRSPIRSVSPPKNRGRSLERSHQDVGDLEAEVEADEDRLLKSIQSKRDAKAKFVEQVRDRQERIMQINEQIRRYDLKVVKETEIDTVKRQVAVINDHWAQMKQELENRFKYCE